MPDPEANRIHSRSANNNNNFDTVGDRTDGFWHPMMGASFFADILGRQKENRKPVTVTQRPSTERDLQTHPREGLELAQNSKRAAKKVRGDPFLSKGQIPGEAICKTPKRTPEELEVHGAPVRESPTWNLEYKIGSGSLGMVFLCKVQKREMELPELWAVKRISRAIPQIPPQWYQTEIMNLRVLSKYDWFVQFKASYEDAHYVYIAMEYIQLGDMAKTFVRGYRWREADTKVVIEQLLYGLAAMHKEGITHHDLKPQNIFLCLSEREAGVLHVKIGDLGSSWHHLHTHNTTFLQTRAGTPGYQAPEVHDTSQELTDGVDIWSIGCILYRMVSGRQLFNNGPEVWKYAMSSSSPLLAVQFTGLSVPGMNFLSAILEVNKDDRPTATTCLTMSWIVDKAPGLQYSIGRNLLWHLSKIKFNAPDIDSYPDVAAGRSMDNTLGLSLTLAPQAPKVYSSAVWEGPASKLECQIGSGPFGDVFLCKAQMRRLESPELWAVKKVPRSIPNLSAERYRAAVQNSRALPNHEWFVRFITSYQDEHFVYIAMEYIPIGDIERTFIKGYRWNEGDTKVVVEQLLNGLAVMHENGITHCNLNPSNIFLCLADNEPRILRVKIGGFGFSVNHLLTNTTTPQSRAVIRTPGYTAPEVDDKTQGLTNRVDIWSLGCTVYRMISGSILFDTPREVWTHAMNASSPPPAVNNIGLSAPCVDFLTAILNPNKDVRPSAEACRTMSWITSDIPGPRYYIGRDLYWRLTEIKLEAPDISSFSGPAAGGTADDISLRSWPAASTPPRDFTRAHLEF